jgi:hypothetical protein
VVLLNLRLTCVGVPTGDAVFFLAAAEKPFAVSSNAMVTLHNTGQLWGIGLQPHGGLETAHERCVALHRGGDAE